MRVLIVCPGLGYGGAETQIIALARGLQARGHAVAIYSLVSGTGRADEVRAAGIPLWEDSKRSRMDWQLLGRLRDVVTSFQPQLVHGFLFDGNLYARLAVFGRGIPVLCAERSSDYELRPIQQWVHRATSWMTTGVIANSWAGADLARRMYGGLKNHIHVVWNGIDVASVRARAARASGLREQLAIPADAKIACFVGSVKPDKDFLLATAVCQALLALPGQPWHIIFIGAPFQQFLPYAQVGMNEMQRYAAEVEQAFEQLSAPDRVHRLGTSKQVIELMAQCNVLFSTSLREGFPNVVLEAMTAGIPVISTAYSDIRMILPEAWQVIEQRDGALLAAAIERAANDTELSARQQAWVDQHATLDVAVLALETVYQQYIQP
ncbi:glycosyltransferase family 4 protein [Pseudoduganella danionis]|uniref:glycosyltransferase family 4 protein n=1 Tax=Pseudoduganella danionis TaxID=1890295 RepID=UPI0035B3DFF7